MMEVTQAADSERNAETPMGQGISEILTFAVGVAISPVPIVAVILMLFSRRARTNGSAFLVGWVVALAVVSTAVYLVSDAGDAATSDAASDAISWGKIALGVLLLLLAVRTWRGRPGPGEPAPMPKWMSGIDALTPAKALVLGFLLAGVSPKNLILAAGAGAGLAQLGLSTSDAVVSLVVFVVIGSLTIAGPVFYYLAGGESAKAELDRFKAWLLVHNGAVMTVLLLVFGASLIAKGIPPLTT
jgi:hypothetical protein